MRDSFARLEIEERLSLPQYSKPCRVAKKGWLEKLTKNQPASCAVSSFIVTKKVATRGVALPLTNNQVTLLRDGVPEDDEDGEPSGLEFISKIKRVVCLAQPDNEDEKPRMM